MHWTPHRLPMDARAVLEAQMSTRLTEAAPYYFHWGAVQISLANALIILAMIAVFVIALLAPFPGGREEAIRKDDDHEQR